MKEYRISFSTCIRSLYNIHDTMQTATISSSYKELTGLATSQKPPSKELLIDILGSSELKLEDILQAAAIPRKKYFSNKVRLHILNNVRNGYCSEDCGYCAQRKTRAADIPSYSDKEDQEIMAEAQKANDSGAFRYCMVTSGRGLTPKTTDQFVNLIKKIKSTYKMEVCLSAGLISDPVIATKLKEAGLDRYNHNLNSGEETYNKICTTHNYQDRLQTMNLMQQAGVPLCSGVIAGMGETDTELAEVALTLHNKNVPSIPVNFFLPVPGHVIKNPTKLTQEKCLRILAAFRLANPDSEIRMAAGREVHIAESQTKALAVADSLFVSGYLNTVGSNTEETLRMIYDADYKIDAAQSNLPSELLKIIKDSGLDKQDQSNSNNLTMKNENQLRPFKK